MFTSFDCHYVVGDISDKIAQDLVSGSLNIELPKLSIEPDWNCWSNKLNSHKLAKSIDQSRDYNFSKSIIDKLGL